MDSLFGTGLSDSFGDFDVNEFEIFSVFDFLSGSCKVDDNVGVFDKSFDEFFVSQIGIPMDPGFI